MVCRAVLCSTPGSSVTRQVPLLCLAILRFGFCISGDSPQSVPARHTQPPHCQESIPVSLRQLGSCLHLVDGQPESGPHLHMHKPEIT